MPRDRKMEEWKAKHLSQEAEITRLAYQRGRKDGRLEGLEEAAKFVETCDLPARWDKGWYWKEGLPAAIRKRCEEK